MSDGGNDRGSEQSRRIGVHSGLKDNQDSYENVACLRKLKPLFTSPWLRRRLPCSWNNNSSPDIAGRDWGHQNNQNHTFIRGYERQHWHPVGGVLQSNYLSPHQTFPHLNLIGAQHRWAAIMLPSHKELEPTSLPSSQLCCSGLNCSVRVEISEVFESAMRLHE